jgi:MFS family permease
VPTYLLAGGVASRLAPDELGPDESTDRESVRRIARGMVDGVRHLAQRRPAARAIGLVTVHRAIFGAATLLTLLQAREVLHPGDPDAAIAAIGITSVAAGAGAFAGAVVTPWMSRRIGPVPWSVLALVVGVCLGAIGVAMPDLAGIVVRGVLLGFAGQAVKVCSDTIVQEDVDDAHRGRVFSWYDVAVNVGIVSGVVLATVALQTAVPEVGMALVMAGVALAAGVWALVRERQDPASSYAEDPLALAPDADPLSAGLAAAAHYAARGWRPDPKAVRCPPTAPRTSKPSRPTSRSSKKGRAEAQSSHNRFSGRGLTAWVLVVVAALLFPMR